MTEQQLEKLNELIDEGFAVKTKTLEGKKNFLKMPGKLSCQMTVDYNSLKKQKQTQCMMRVLVLSNTSA